VLDGLKGNVRSRKLLVTGTVALAFLSSVIGIQFHRYAYAIAWHCIHRNPTPVGEHRIGLPILWWEERGSGWNDESLVERGVLSLVRANPAASYQPRIIARPAVADDRQRFAHSYVPATPTRYLRNGPRLVLPIIPDQAAAFKPSDKMIHDCGGIDDRWQENRRPK